MSLSLASSSPSTRPSLDFDTVQGAQIAQNNQQPGQSTFSSAGGFSAVDHQEFQIAILGWTPANEATVPVVPYAKINSNVEFFQHVNNQQSQHHNVSSDNRSEVQPFNSSFTSPQHHHHHHQQGTSSSSSTNQHQHVITPPANVNAQEQQQQQRANGGRGGARGKRGDGSAQVPKGSYKRTKVPKLLWCDSIPTEHPSVYLPALDGQQQHGRSSSLALDQEQVILTNNTYQVQSLGSPSVGQSKSRKRSASSSFSDDPSSSSPVVSKKRRNELSWLDETDGCAGLSSLLEDDDSSVSGSCVFDAAFSPPSTSTSSTASSLPSLSPASSSSSFTSPPTSVATPPSALPSAAVASPSTTSPPSEAATPIHNQHFEFTEDLHLIAEAVEVSFEQLIQNIQQNNHFVAFTPVRINLTSNDPSDIGFWDFAVQEDEEEY